MTTKKEENLLLCKGTLMMTFKQRISKSVYLTFFVFLQDVWISKKLTARDSHTI